MNKYKLIKGTSIILLTTALTGCMSNKKTSFNTKYFEREKTGYTYTVKDNEDKKYTYENENDSTRSIEEDSKSSDTTNYTVESTPSLESSCDEETIQQIINQKIFVDDQTSKDFLNYVKSIEVYYPNQELYGVDQALQKYYSLTKNSNNYDNLFEKGYITADELYNIVYNNNKTENFKSSAILSDSDLKKICSIMSDLINYYISNHNDDLKLLSSKISNLKIKQFSDFGNGFYDFKTGTLGISTKTLNGSSNFLKTTVEHETFHIFQVGNNSEEWEYNFGPCYQFNDIKLNTLFWNWFYEGSAQNLMLHYNNIASDEKGTYKDSVNSIETVKIANILDYDKNVYSFEELSLNNDLEKVFDYFNCETDLDKIEITKLMYAYNLLFNIDSITSEFYKNVNMTSSESLTFERYLKGSIAQTLSKQFYKSLIGLISNKEINLDEVFSYISVFENEISRQIWYKSNKDYLSDFFETYNNIQSEFFGIIASKLDASTDEIQQSYNYLDKNNKIIVSNLTMINDEKKDFLNHILDTRKNDKVGSINIISGGNENKKAK